MPATARSPLPAVLAAVFAEFTCWKLIAPLLPLWAARLGAHPLQVGLLVSAFAAAELGCAPLLGTASDRFGRRPVLLASLAASAASFTLIALAHSVPVLLAAQLLGGCGAAVVSVGQAAIADRTPAPRLAQAMAYLAGVIGVAYVAGPALGAGLSLRAPGLALAAAAVLAAVNTVVAAVLLPETHPGGARTGGAAVRWSALLARPGMAALAAATLIFGSVIATLEAMLPLFTRAALGWAEAANGALFAYLGAVLVLMQFGVVGAAARRFGERPVLLGGLVVAGTGLLVLGGAGPAGGAAAVLAGVGLVAAGAGVVIPLLPTLFCLTGPPGAHGSVLGMAQALTALARLTAPVAAGVVFDRAAGAPFLAIGLGCLAVAVLAGRPVQARSRGGT